MNQPYVFRILCVTATSRVGGQPHQKRYRCPAVAVCVMKLFLAAFLFILSHWAQLHNVHTQRRFNQAYILWAVLQSWSAYHTLCHPPLSTRRYGRVIPQEEGGKAVTVATAEGDVKLYTAKPIAKPAETGTARWGGSIKSKRWSTKKRKSKHIS